MSRAPWLLSTAVLLLCAGAARAQQDPKDDLLSLLNQKVTSASRFAQRIADAPAAVTVITAEDIQRMGAEDLGDVLRVVPGLNLRAIAKGDYTISARNDAILDSPNILILLDGRTTDWPLYSSTLWETVPVALDQIERIEVVRGPGSTLYGGNAYDGVINITTRRPTGGTHATASLGAGSGETRVDAVYRQTAGAFRFDGFVESDRENPAAPYGSLPNTPVMDFDHRLLKGTARVGWSTPQGLDLELSGGISKGSIATYWAYGMPWAPLDLTDRHVLAELTHNHLPGELVLHSRFYYSWDGATSTTDAEVTVDRAAGNNHLLAGTALRRNWGSCVPIINDNHAQSLYGAFVQDSWSPSAHVELIGGARYDYDPDRQGAFSPRASLLLKPSQRHTFRLSASRAFRMESLMEAFMYSVTPTQIPGVQILLLGNPDLAPQEIESFEAGYIGSLARGLDVTLDLFHNRFLNQINVVTTQLLSFPHGGSMPTRLEYANRPGPSGRGGEVGLHFSPGDRLHFQANYGLTLLDDTLGQRIASTPEHKLNAELGFRPLSRLWLDATEQYASAVDFGAQVSPQQATQYGGTAMPAGWITDVNARLDVGHGVAASVFVINAFDRRYRDFLGAEPFGRRALVRLDVGF